MVWTFYYFRVIEGFFLGSETSMGSGRGLWKRVWKFIIYIFGERDKVLKGGSLGREGNVGDIVFNADLDVLFTVK